MPSPDKDENKTHLRTIRIPESLERSLEKEAADESTTVNAKINSILSRHYNWDKKIQEFGYAEIPKSLLMSMLEGLDDKTLARIGREVIPTLWKDLAEFWSQGTSPESVISFMGTRSKFNPGSQTRITQEEGVYTIVFHHEFGPKWSIMAKNAFQEYVGQTFHVEPRISMGESTVTARFKVNPQDSPL
ncbi:MAG: hypothetical protein ABSB53_07505 [Nitrososphaerales archaeon]